MVAELGSLECPSVVVFVVEDVQDRSPRSVGLPFDHVQGGQDIEACFSPSRALGIHRCVPAAHVACSVPRDWRELLVSASEP